MKVFISWSGDHSRKFAELLNSWIPKLLQNAEPFFTSKDIRSGQRWAPEIWEKLNESHFGIICLTPDNLKSEWVHFEAGALSKMVKESQVCPLLVNLKESQVKPPLSLFQMKLYSLL